MNRKCVWCGQPAGVIVRVIIEGEGKDSGEMPTCWKCLFATAAKRLGLEQGMKIKEPQKDR